MNDKLSRKQKIVYPLFLMFGSSCLAVFISLIIEGEIFAGIICLITSLALFSVLPKIYNAYKSNHNRKFCKILFVVWACWTVLFFYAGLSTTNTDESSENATTTDSSSTSSTTSTATTTSNVTDTETTTTEKSSTTTTTAKPTTTTTTTTTSKPTTTTTTTTTTTSKPTTTTTTTTTTTATTKSTHREDENIVGVSDKDIDESRILFHDKVTNDVTGKWKCLVIYENGSSVDYALSCYKNYYGDATLLVVENLYTKVCMTISELSPSTLSVSVYEYVDGEENNAKIMASGMCYGDYFVYTDDGDIDEILETTTAQSLAIKQSDSITKRSTTTAESYAEQPNALYVLNPESMKIHYSDCRTLKHYENFIETNDLDEALKNGYSRCGVCMR